MRLKRIRKKEDNYISTIEARKMLGIARSTASKYFDLGILTGDKHPITYVPGFTLDDPNPWPG